MCIFFVLDLLDCLAMDTSDLKYNFLTDHSYLLKIANSNEFYGIYSDKNSVYRISLNVPEFPSMRNSEVKILKDLQNFTFEYNVEWDDITEFLNKFYLASKSHRIDMDTKSKEFPSEFDLVKKREDIMRQLHLQSKNDAYEISVTPDMSAIKFSTKGHYLNLSITNEMDVKVSEHSLPECKVKWLNSPTGTIEMYLNEFTRNLEELEEFFSNLNTIDQLCLVVDPVVLSTKYNWRIFKIDKKCFVKVVIDPLLPSSIMVTFIGPTMQVEQYRDKYEKGTCKWDPALDVHKNLLKIFDLVYFPIKIDQSDEDELSCSICGMFRMDDSIPMISCDNMKCDLVFHVACLKQWFSMFKDSKMFLHVELNATCPMCKEKLSTSVELL